MYFLISKSTLDGRKNCFQRILEKTVVVVPLKNKLAKMLARKEKTIKNGSTWWVVKMGWKGFFAMKVLLKLFPAILIYNNTQTEQVISLL